MKKGTNACLYRIALFLLLLESAIVGPSWAGPLQAGKVTGVVTSGTDGEPLIGVSVQIKEDSGKGTVTDLDGKFVIEASKGQTLVFSYIGYISQEVKITKSVLNVELKENAELLDEVVVIGYGTMKRSDLTGSVVSVSGDELKKSVVTSLDQALQGRAAGVQVTQNSGAPGGGISVSIRGINSLNGNEPLYVIDGVAISGNASGNSSVLSSINPSDIVSMSIAIPNCRKNSFSFSLSSASFPDLLNISRNNFLAIFLAAAERQLAAILFFCTFSITDI